MADGSPMLTERSGTNNRQGSLMAESSYTIRIRCSCCAGELRSYCGVPCNCWQGDSPPQPRRGGRDLNKMSRSNLWKERPGWCWSNKICGGWPTPPRLRGLR